MPNKPLADLKKGYARLENLNPKPRKDGKPVGKVIADVHNAPNTYFTRRPCGITQLDIDTGGGLPAGGLSYISGPDGVGKTFLLYKYAAMCQKLYGEKAGIALGVSEAAPDHFLMRRCGVWVQIPEAMIEEQVQERKDRGDPPFTKEELAFYRHRTVGTVKIIRGATGEELLGALLECFESQCFDIVTCDSVSALMPLDELGKDLDEHPKRAAAAQMLTRFFQSYLNGTTGYYGRNFTTVLFTSQVRSNSKKAEAAAHIAKYLPDYAPQGAWAAKHGKLVDILLKPGAKEKEIASSLNGHAGSVNHLRVNADDDDEKRKKNKVNVGKTVYYEILKGKAGVHEGITGEYDYHYNELHDDARSVIMAGISRGLVVENQGFVTFYDPATGKPFEELTNIAGIDRMVIMIRENFRIELMTRRAVLSRAGIQCTYR